MLFLQESVEIELQDFYGNMSNIDMFLLALLERDNSTNTQPGYAIKMTTERQLKRLRDADFYWFENNVNG